MVLARRSRLLVALDQVVDGERGARGGHRLEPGAGRHKRPSLARNWRTRRASFGGIMRRCPSMASQLAWLSSITSWRTRPDPCGPGRAAFQRSDTQPLSRACCI